MIHSWSAISQIVSYLNSIVILLMDHKQWQSKLLWRDDITWSAISHILSCPHCPPCASLPTMHRAHHVMSCHVTGAIIATIKQTSMWTNTDKKTWPSQVRFWVAECLLGTIVQKRASCQNQVQLWVAKSMQMSPAFASGCYNNILICAFSSHVTGTSGWLPPQSSWDGGGTGLPFGWEAANDKEGRVYYVKWVVMMMMKILIMMREGSFMSSCWHWWNVFKTTVESWILFFGY